MPANESFDLAMNNLKNLKRYSKRTSPASGAPEGSYIAGIHNDKFASLFGQTIATWVHVEDMMIQVLQDLLGSKNAPARQIFHSVRANSARKKLMLACLQKAQINAKKSDLYEIIISQFSALTDLRNTYLHGLWYTHESGRVFLSESAMDDFHYVDAREIPIDELHIMNKAISTLTHTIFTRGSPSLARIIALRDIPLPQPVRRNKRAYRQSKGERPSRPT